MVAEVVRGVNTETVAAIRQQQGDARVAKVVERDGVGKSCML
jgi:hypothetical protein